MVYSNFVLFKSNLTAAHAADDSSSRYSAKNPFALLGLDVLGPLPGYWSGQLESKQCSVEIQPAPSFQCAAAPADSQLQLLSSGRLQGSTVQELLLPARRNVPRRLRASVRDFL